MAKASEKLIREALKKQIAKKAYRIFEKIANDFHQGENLDSGAMTYCYAALQKQQFFAGSGDVKKLPFFNTALIVTGSTYYIDADYSPAQGVMMDIYSKGQNVFSVIFDGVINITVYIPGDWEKSLNDFKKHLRSLIKQ